MLFYKVFCKWYICFRRDTVYVELIVALKAIGIHMET